jgi:hypothetical protein
MGMTKQYLLKILENCSDEQFGQDAVEWAIISGWIQLTGNLQTDLRTIMGEPNICPHCQTLHAVADTLKCDECGADMIPRKPGLYDSICDGFRRRCRDLDEQTAEAMQPLIEEILRPVSLAPH